MRRITGLFAVLFFLIFSSVSYACPQVPGSNPAVFGTGANCTVAGGASGTLITSAVGQFRFQANCNACPAGQVVHNNSCCSPLSCHAGTCHDRGCGQGRCPCPGGQNCNTATNTCYSPMPGPQCPGGAPGYDGIRRCPHGWICAGCILPFWMGGGSQCGCFSTHQEAAHWCNVMLNGEAAHCIEDIL